MEPSLLEDQCTREKFHCFDRERTIVHARGTAGAHWHGYHYFNAYVGRPRREYTYASVPTDPSRSTPTFVRFSTVDFCSFIFIFSIATNIQGIKQRVWAPNSRSPTTRHSSFTTRWRHMRRRTSSAQCRLNCFELSHCDDSVVSETYTKLAANIDFDLANQVVIHVGGVDPDKATNCCHGKSTPTLSQVYYIPEVPTIKSRRIFILIADGFNAAEVEAMRAEFGVGQVTTWIIGPRRGWIYLAGKGDGV